MCVCVVNTKTRDWENVRDEILKKAAKPNARVSRMNNKVNGPKECGE